jgi:hypothetical protein
MQNKLKLAVATTALVAVALVAAHPATGSTGLVTQAGIAPAEFRVGGAWAEGAFKRFDELLSGIRPWRAPAPVFRPVLPPGLADVLTQEAARPVVARVRAVTRWLTDEERVRVVGEACQVKDDFDAARGTPADRALARAAHANETVGRIIGPAQAVQEIREAFRDERPDRYGVLGQQLICQAAEFRS